MMDHLNLEFLLPLLPVAAAAMLAWAAYQLAGMLRLPRIHRSRLSRIEHFAGERQAEHIPQAAIGSREYKARSAFAKLGIDVRGREEQSLLLARLSAGSGFVVLLLLAGLPLLTSLSGLAAGIVFVNGWIERTWRRTGTEMESELPSLLLRLNATLQASPNVPAALETVARTLSSGGPLRTWTLETAGRMHAEGYAAIEGLRESAAGHSTSLSIAADMIGRMWTTGGEGYAHAFAAAAENLEAVLDARVLARAKGSSAQGTVNILTAMTFVMIAFMSRSGAMAEIVRTPLVQALYALICLVIVYGHSQVSAIIDNAV